MVTLMKFIYIFTSIINVIGPIAYVANAVQAYKRHNKYARNCWFVATVIWIVLFVYQYKLNFCM
jgi:small neutral amino acid transporter SnatA (MarC family)